MIGSRISIVGALIAAPFAGGCGNAIGSGSPTSSPQLSSDDTRSSPNHCNDLSHDVPVEPGQTYFHDGDRITVDEVHGTSNSIAAGNLYEIKGTYMLASRGKASLAVEVTSNDVLRLPQMKTQTMLVEKGSGHFTVFLYMWGSGSPHMSFYPADGCESFASIYFGTGDSVLRWPAGASG
jgi:hypothetical protein